MQSKHAFLFATLGAMLAAVVVGLILSAAAPASFNAALSANLLSPVKTMYLNALKMVVAPVVFFSIASCISQFSDLSTLGRIGGKTLALYLCTTLIAVGVGIGAFYLFQPGSANLAGLEADASSITSKTMNVSIRDTIVGIVPTNFLSPFLESNMLQLIFLAVVCSVAVGLIGNGRAGHTGVGPHLPFRVADADERPRGGHRPGHGHRFPHRHVPLHEQLPGRCGSDLHRRQD